MIAALVLCSPGCAAGQNVSRWQRISEPQVGKSVGAVHEFWEGKCADQQA